MQSTGVKMEIKKKKDNTQDWNRRSHTHDRGTREEISTGDNHQPTNKTKEFRKYKRISCMHLCSVPLPTKLDIKTFELAPVAQWWVCCDSGSGNIWSE